MGISSRWWGLGRGAGRAGEGRLSRDLLRKIPLLSDIKIMGKELTSDIWEEFRCKGLLSGEFMLKRK